MAAKAFIRSSYRWRLGIIAVALLAVGGWFLYDGIVGYPTANIKRNRYLELLDKHGAEVHKEIWPEEAKREGWPIDKPKAPHSEWDIFAQFCYAVPALFFGAWFAIGYLRAGGRWIESDERGLTTSSGQQVTWDQIETVDKSRWETKGIVVVNYLHDNKPGRITLDDWKFEREPTTTIVSEINAHMPGSDQESHSSEPKSTS